MKNRTTFSKIMAFTMSFLFLLTTAVQPISADGPVLYRYKGDVRGHDVQTETNNHATALFNVGVKGISGSEFRAYCIDARTTIRNDKDYVIATLEDVDYFAAGSPVKIRGIIFGSYPEVPLSELQAIVPNLTEKEAISATQLAIWKYSNGEQIKTSFYTANNTSASNKRIYALYEHLITLEKTNSAATLDVEGPTVDNSNADFALVTYKYKTTGIDADEIEISYGFDVEGDPVVTADGDFTQITVKVLRSNIDHMEDYLITLNGSKVFYDAFVFTPVEGREASQTLVSTGHSETQLLQEQLSFNVPRPIYNVRFYVDDIDVGHDTFHSGEDVTPPAMGEDGKVFHGWYTGTDFNTLFDSFDEMPAEDVDVYGFWSMIDYSLVINYLDADDHVLETAHVESGMNVGDTYSVNSPVIPGYTTIQLTVANTMPAENVEIDVVYTPIDYTFTFDPNFGTEANVVQGFQVGGEVDGTTFEREGYTFTGWTTDEVGETAFTGSLTNLPANNMYVFAQWEAIDYTLIYVTNMPGLSYPNETFNAGDSIDSPTPSVPGFNFLGWYWAIMTDNDDSGMLIDAGKLFRDMPAFDVTVEAQWEAIDYTFTFDPNFGTEANVEQGFQVGGEVDGTTFTREGFTFAGWTTDEAGETAYTGGLVELPAGDIYVFAQWNEVLPEEFVLTYVTNQPGLAIDNVIFLEGDAIVAPAPTAEGFIFLGWFTDEALEIPFDEFNSMPANDVIVYADWGEVLGEEGYQITFVTNKPSITIGNMNYGEGDAITEPAPILEGYTFLGWYADEAMTVKFESFNAMPGENVIVYADWGEVLGEEDELPDTSDNSQSTGLGLLFLMLGSLALLMSKKENEVKQ